MNSWKLDVGWLFSFVTHQLPRINCLVMLKYDGIESLYLYLIKVYFRTFELDQSYRKLLLWPMVYGFGFTLLNWLMKSLRSSQPVRKIYLLP